MTGTGTTRAQFRKFLLYVLKFVEYNRAKYEKLKDELAILREETAASKEEVANIKDELTYIMVSYQAPPAPSAPQAAALPLPSAPQAVAPPPPPTPRVAVPIPPSAPQAMAAPSAFQAVVLPSAPQAMAIRPVVSSTTFSPPILNADGTISHKMDPLGNNRELRF